MERLLELEDVGVGSISKAKEELSDKELSDGITVLVGSVLIKERHY